VSLKLELTIKKSCTKLLFCHTGMNESVKGSSGKGRATWNRRRKVEL